MTLYIAQLIRAFHWYRSGYIRVQIAVTLYIAQLIRVFHWYRSGYIRVQIAVTLYIAQLIRVSLVSQWLYTGSNHIETSFVLQASQLRTLNNRAKIACS